MSRFTWADEERRFKRRVHGCITAAMHGSLACDIHPGGRGDRAAVSAAEQLWNFQRFIIEQHRSEVAELKSRIKVSNKQTTNSVRVR